VLLWSLLFLPALADPGTRSGFDVGASEFEVEDDDDDGGMRDYAEEAKRRPPETTNFHLDPSGKQPMGNDWPLHTVSANSAWIKLELPVLVALDRPSFVAEHPHGIRLISEWDIGGQLTVREQILRPESIWEQGATFAFLQVAVPDGRKTAPVRIKVLTADLPAPPAEPVEGEEAEEAPPAVAPPKVRYAVTSVFYRKDSDD
jgi:hypothetical protein